MPKWNLFSALGGLLGTADSDATTTKEDVERVANEHLGLHARVQADLDRGPVREAPGKLHGWHDDCQGSQQNKHK